MVSGRKGITGNNQTQQQKQKDGLNAPVEPQSPGHSIMNFFKSQQLMQKPLNESFTSNSSFNSAQNGTMVDLALELPQMVSVLQIRRKELENRSSEISKIKDEQIKSILLAMVNDMKNVVDDSDNILRCHNELLSKQSCDSEEIQLNRTSINNLTTGVGNLTDGIFEVKSRVQSLEVTKNCTFDSHFINVVFVDAKDAECVENGLTGPKQKLADILTEMKIVTPSNVVDTHLMTVRRFVNGRRKQIKMLRTRFSDTVTAGRILSQIINHNKTLTDSGKQDAIKYFSEMPASKNVWNLKKICYELKNEGTFVNVRGSDRGILVSYKIKNKDDDKESVKTVTVTSEKEVDDLRKELNVADAYVSVGTKYDDDYWRKKRNPGTTQKRIREIDENDSTNDPKRPSSSNQMQ